MQRVCAEYTITVKVMDVMNISDDTDQSVDSLIKQDGQKIIKKYLNGKLFDPDNKVIREQIKITEKGL
jgi:hypothetical protein